MGIYISGVKGLPEQVQENKENIKDIQEEISGIDWDAIHNLENQVAENTQDINNMEGTIGTQNIAITQLGGRVDDLEGTTSNLNQSATTLTVDSNLDVSGNIGFTEDDSGNIELNNETNGGNKIVSKQDSNNYIAFDSSNCLHIMSDGGEYEFSGDQILVNSTPIGGSTLYEHHIEYADTLAGNYTNFSATLITTTSTAFTNSTLADYLYTKGLTSNTNDASASGVVVYAGSSNVVVGLHSANGTNLSLEWYAYSDGYTKSTNITTGTINDKVIQIS